MTKRLHFHFSLSCIGEGNGNPLQCSCLENPRDGRDWWAAVYGVAQSWTRLNRLSCSNSFLLLHNILSQNVLAQNTKHLLSQFLRVRNGGDQLGSSASRSLAEKPLRCWGRLKSHLRPDWGGSTLKLTAMFVDKIQLLQLLN